MSFYTRDDYPGFFIIEDGQSGKKGDRVVLANKYLQNYSIEDIKNTVEFIKCVSPVCAQQFAPFPTRGPCPLDCETINIYGQHIHNIPRLAMKNIRKIRAIHTSISKLSGFYDYPRLTELDISYGQLTAAIGLSQLSALTKLNLSNNLITRANFTCLGNITELDLSHNKIADLSELIGLNALINLRKFNIGFNQLSGLAGIECVKNLEELSAHCNKITDIGEIAQLKSLKYLNVANNNIRDFPAMKQKKIVELIIYNNQISDVRAFAGLKNIERLDLFGNNIRDISELSVHNGLKHLKYLGLDDNPIENVDGFKPASRDLAIALTSGEHSATSVTITMNKVKSMRIICDE